jgi:hypothetical protein
MFTSKEIEARDLDQRAALMMLRDAGCKKAGTDWSAGEALLAWTGGWLRSRGVVAEDSRRILLQEIGPHIIAYGNELPARLGDSRPLPVCQLLITDLTFAALSGLPHYVDLRNGSTRAELALPPIEVFSCNLVALYAYHAGRVQHARDSEEKAAVPAANGEAS